MASRLTQFGVSRNLRAGLIEPLRKSHNLEDSVLEHLERIHSELWGEKPPENPPGQFLELQLAYSYAVDKGWKVLLGAASGGDLRVTNTQGFQTTFQAKGIHSQNTATIRRNIAEAAEQLTGARGEEPGSQHGRVIFLRLAGAFPFEAQEFASQIVQALGADDVLYQNVNEIQVEENQRRHRYLIPNKPGQPVRYMGMVKVHVAALGSPEELAAHWKALRTWSLNCPFDRKQTLLRGCCSGPGTPPLLPWQTRSGAIVVDYRTDESDG